MPGAGCGPDHNPVIATVTIKIKRIRKTKQNRRWNVEKQKNINVSSAYQSKLSKQLEDNKIGETGEIWVKRKAL